jgi:uroporphyrinogen-III synthase
VTSPVIVTRPALPGQRLTALLERRGLDAVWWPAFDIDPPQDSNAVRARLASLAEFDLAVFVSSNAVHVVAGLLEGDWPPSTVIGAVGAATRDAALAELRGAQQAAMVAPDVDDVPGSEAFWRAWQASGRSARRALLLRAESGRDWIVERLSSAGAAVEPLAVYRRRPHHLGSADADRLLAWLGSNTRPIAVVTSSEAVAALLGHLRGFDGADGWLRQGIAIATHPRVAQRLHSAGFHHVETCEADDEAIVRKLKSIADRAAGSH